jgi:hypothetical protein
VANLVVQKAPNVMYKIPGQLIHEHRLKTKASKKIRDIPEELDLFPRVPKN